MFDVYIIKLKIDFSLAKILLFSHFKAFYTTFFTIFAL